jgi:hypothetical protein
MIKAKYKNDEVAVKIKGDLSIVLNEFDAIVTSLHESISEATNEKFSKHLIKKAFKNGFSNYEKKEGKENE